MKPFTFSEYYVEWLESFRRMLPGGAQPAAKDPSPKQAQVAANEEWEDEGGSIKPERKPDLKAVSSAPKIPF